MMWRYNETTHIFEVSTNNGSSWSAPTLEASVINSGSLADARLSSNVPLKNGSNVFSASNNEFQELLKVDKGLSFPATQVASAGANDLDDYEEGTWTPIIGGATSESGQSYTTQAGFYTKFGRTVVANFQVVLSAKGTITGTLQLKGLPFTSANLTGNRSTGTFQWALFVTGFVYILASLLANSGAADLNGLTAAGTGFTGLVTGDIGNTSQLQGTLVYQAAT